MGTAIHTDGSKTRNTGDGSISSTDGSLQLRLGVGESIICHKPGEPFTNLEIRMVDINRNRASLVFVGDDFEVWRSLLWRKRLEQYIKA